MVKLALVTGGGRGIGAAIARRLARDGLSVIVCGRSEAELSRVAADIGGSVAVVDLCDRDQTDREMAALLDRVGPIDVLVNNAGSAVSAPLANHTDTMWDDLFELNATAAFRLCRAWIPHMVARGWGRVINIASNAGLTGYRYSAAYCASKHAVIGFTRALALDVATTGVTINAVCPGWVDTEMAQQAIARIASATDNSHEWARRNLERMSPQQRLFAPDEVAHAVAMLVSDEARGICGQTLVIDGGQVLK